MSTKLPVFSMLEPQHFSDYGFDPQMDYFQVLEEARKHKRETTRSIDTLHFKLQKPISKDDQKKSSKKKRRWWWKNAVLFFKTKWAAQHQRPSPLEYHHQHQYQFSGSISGPIYVTESLSGSTTPYRTTSRPTSGPIAGTMTPTRKGDLDISYINLKDLNMEAPTHVMSSAPPMPIYLVT